MKSNLFCALVLLFKVFSVLGQERILKVIDHNSLNLSLENNSKIEGNPYLIDEWNKGDVITTILGNLKANKLKYNVFHEVLEINRNGQVIYLDNNLIGGFTIHENDSTTLNFTKIEEKNGALRFAKILTSGRITLLELYEIDLIKPKRITHFYSTSDRSNVPKYSNLKTEYRLFLPDGKKHKVKLKNKDIRKRLDKSEQVLFDVIWKKNRFKKDDYYNIVFTLNQMNRSINP